MNSNLIIDNKDKESLFINIFKSFAIALVVSGHIGGIFNLLEIPVNNIEIFNAYSFHMPAFIFVSGYYFKFKKTISIKNFIKDKVIKLVIPYYMANLCYGIIVHFLKKYGIFTNCRDLTLTNLLIEPWLSGYQFNLNGPSWFVLFLFLVQITYFALKKIIYLKKDIINKSDEFKLLLGFILLGFLSTYLARIELIKENSVYWGLIRVMFGLQFYHLGFVYRTFFKKIISINLKSLAILILTKLIFVNIFSNYSFSMRALLFKDSVFLPFVTSILGIYYLMHISYFVLVLIYKFNLHNVKKVFCLIGSNTWSVMMHHMTINLIYTLFIKQYSLKLLDYILLPILAVSIPIVWVLYYNKILNYVKSHKFNSPKLRDEKAS